MRTHVLLISACAIFAGCGTPAKPNTVYGSFVSAAPLAHEKLMAEDATRQLVSLYPPAGTHLALAHAATDTFGSQLMEKIRSQGYALQEHKAQASAKDSPDAVDHTKATTDVSFGYVLDEVASPRLYRVTLNVGHQTISRAYVPQDDLVHPAGAWVRKE